MVTRLQALESKISEWGPSRQEFSALISELAMLNSNVRALTEVMASNLKQFEGTKERVSNVDTEKTPATGKSIGNTIHPPPHPATCEPEGADRTRYYTRVQSGRRGKEVVRAPSPPQLVLNADGPVSKNVHSPSANVEATFVEEGAGGSTSPGSDCALISPPAKALKIATTSRKRPASNARGKTIAKESAAEAGTTLALPPSKDVSNNNIELARMKQAASMKWVANFLPPQHNSCIRAEYEHKCGRNRVSATESPKNVCWRSGGNIVHEG